MQIRFSLTQDDLIAFNDHHMAHSPTLQRSLSRIRWTITSLTVLAGLAALGMGGFWGEPYTAILGFSFTFAGVWFYFTFPETQRRRARKMVEQMLQEGKTPLGDRTLTVEPSGLSSTSDAGTATLKWSAIDRIVQDDAYIFAFMGALQAVVIPKRAFSDPQEALAFAERMETLRLSAAASPKPAPPPGTEAPR